MQNLRDSYLTSYDLYRNLLNGVRSCHGCPRTQPPKFLPWRCVWVGLGERVNVHMHAPCASCLLPSPAATNFPVGKIHFPYLFVGLFFSWWGQARSSFLSHIVLWILWSVAEKEKRKLKILLHQMIGDSVLKTELLMWRADAPFWGDLWAWEAVFF